MQQSLQQQQQQIQLYLQTEREILREKKFKKIKK